MKMPDLFVTVAPSRACAHTVLCTIHCTAPSPSAFHAVFRLAAPSFSIPPSHARTVKHHPLCSILLHLPIPRPHRQTPSSLPHLSPSHHSVPAPSISIPYAPFFSILPSRAPTVFLPPRFPPVFVSGKRNSKKLQKNAKKVLTNRGRGGIISKLSAREQPLQQRRPPLPHSGRTLKIKQCMTERNT